MKTVRAMIMTALLVPLAACGASEEEEAEAQAEAEALAESLGGALDEAADEAAAEAEATAAAAEPTEAEAPPAAGGGDTCEEAWTGIMQMVAAMKKQMGGGAGEPEEDAEKRAEFMEKCGELPPEVQQCLVMSYAMEHQQECEQYRDQLQAVQAN